MKNDLFRGNIEGCSENHVRQETLCFAGHNTSFYNEISYHQTVCPKFDNDSVSPDNFASILNGLKLVKSLDRVL